MKFRAAGPLALLLCLSGAVEAADLCPPPLPQPHSCLAPLPAAHWRQRHDLKDFDPVRALAVARKCVAASADHGADPALRVAIATLVYNAGKQWWAGELLGAIDRPDDPLVLYTRADFLYRSWNVGEPNPAAVRLAERAAAAGSVDALILLGFLHEGSAAGKADHGAAYANYLKAAQRGCPEGMTKLGMYYQFGTHVAQDWALALKWYLRAAEAGDTVAMVYAGYIYEDGPADLRDIPKGLYWYRRSVALGYGGGMLNLGWMYRYGKGVPRDYGEALRWYRRSYAKGVMEALNNIGVLYMDGLGVRRNLRRAGGYFLHAASNRSEANAMANLGILYGFRFGPPLRSRQSGYFWLYAAWRKAESEQLRERIFNDLVDLQESISEKAGGRIRGEAIRWLNGDPLPDRYRTGLRARSEVGPP